MSFPKLLEVALAGTLRQEPPAGLAAHTSLSAESRMLRSASYEGMRRLAGRPLERVDEVVPVEPARPEELAEVPAAAAQRLHEILDGVTKLGLLREWLQLAASRKLRVPPLSLPDLLEYARSETDSDLRDLIAQAGGERMAWLARLNPAWRFAAHADPEQQLALGSHDGRADALRRIRRQDPTRGRERLQEVWPSERGDSRAKLLDALAIGLLAEDEPFLDHGVRDSRKEVRETALRLIRRVPNSRFGQRWVDRARQVISLNQGRPRGARFEIHEPIEADPEWVADGLDPRPPKGTGTTAWLLQQILALTPPSTWPLAVLDAIDHTDWPRPLLAGLGEAAQAYGDADWCEALLMLWASTAEHRDRLPLNITGLFAAFEPARAEPVLRRLIESGPPLVGHLGNGEWTEQWSEDFSRFVIAQIALRLSDKRQNTIMELLFTVDASLRLDPRVLPEAERLLDAETEPIGVRSMVAGLVRTLEFRAAMHKEFNE